MFYGCGDGGGGDDYAENDAGGVDGDGVGYVAGDGDGDGDVNCT